MCRNHGFLAVFLLQDKKPVLRTVIYISYDTHETSVAHLYNLISDKIAERNIIFIDFIDIFLLCKYITADKESGGFNAIYVVKFDKCG